MKSILKLIFAFSGACLAISCVKSSASNSGYYFQASISGTNENFNNTVVATEVTGGTGSNSYQLTISGVSGTTMNNASTASIVLFSNTPNFTAGNTFTINTAPTGTKNVFIYSPPQIGSTLGIAWSSDYTYSPVNESLTCTITEATSTYIKGTFSTVIYQNNASAVISQPVTAGTFYAKFVAP